ncbi:MAG: hypothetical protein JNL11_01325 [Bdellovibrionaceae bacterium]|nr:hypothetical protein [Pseudobdellovibrionaceae bacterium]
MTRSQTTVNLASLIVAFASMVYELGLAQILSALLGGTSLRYAVTIGLFTATLGIGALTFDALKDRYPSEVMFPFFQNLLAWVGLLSPFFLIELKSEHWVLNHLPIIVIGFLSGIELPLLMNISSEKKRNLVLAYDYVGMFAATLFFPLILLPRVGVISTVLVATVLNAAIGLFFMKEQRFGFIKSALLVVLLLSILALINQESVLRYASQAFI